MSKAKTFTLFFALASFLAFFATASSGILGIDLSRFTEDVIMIVFGVALASIGQIRKFFEYPQDGLRSDEIMNIIAIVIGLAAILTGLIGFFDVTFVKESAVQATKGIIAFIGLFLTGFQIARIVSN